MTESTATAEPIKPRRRLVAGQIIVIVVVLLLIGLFAYGLLFRKEAPRPSSGAAPDFTLTLFPDYQAKYGDQVGLADLRGKVVVLNFWASWCGPCRAEMPEFVKTAADEDLVVLAVNDGEDRKAVEEFAAAFGMKMPVVLDRNGMLGERYLVQGLPTTYFIDSQGKLSSMVVGQITPEALDARLAAIRSDG